MGRRPFERKSWAMSDEEELPIYCWFYAPDQCIVVAGEDQPLDIRDALLFRHQLDNAIRDYEKAAGR